MDKAKMYSFEKYCLFFIGAGIAILFLILFQMFFSSMVKDLSLEVGHSFYLTLFIYLWIFSVMSYFFSFPIYFYETYILDHKYSLSNLTPIKWIKDEFKKGILSFLIYSLFVGLFYFVLISVGKYWWVVLALVWILFTVFFSRIMPTLIIPMFYKTTDIDEISLKEKILNLAKKAGIKIIDIFKIDLSAKTKKANAAVVGIGASRRVLLGDTLLDNFSHDEIVCVCAHEFGHHKFRHIRKHMLFSSISTLLGFYVLDLCIVKLANMMNVSSIHDISLLPSYMLVLYLFGLIMMPIQNAFSRKLETEADTFALESTQNRSAFISVMEKLAKINLADTNPPKILKWIFYSHPPISERIALAKEFDDSK